MFTREKDFVPAVIQMLFFAQKMTGLEIFYFVQIASAFQENVL